MHGPGPVEEGRNGLEQLRVYQLLTIMIQKLLSFLLGIVCPIGLVGWLLLY
jgi:hypothetical protein